MNDLLTTTELQQLLKLDRTTVYRMLKDGRLRGVKVGQQWRFPHQVVEVLLSEPRPQPQAPAVFSLPLHCVQTIQDLFADLAEVAVLTLDLAGSPLTAPSGERQAIQQLRQACAVIARTPGCIPKQIDGVTDQQYEVMPILIDRHPQALLIAGPVEQAVRAALRKRLARLARSLESLGTERAAMVARLNQIAALSTFAEDVPIATRTE